MAEFDYNALAELFPTRRLPRRQSFGYKRFAKAALAIRFAMEDLPRGCLAGAFLEVNERSTAATTSVACMKARTIL